MNHSDRRQPRKSGSEPKSSTKNLMPRGTALGAVEGVLAKGVPLDGALAGRPEWKRMEPRDRAFARAIASSVIRRPIALDAALMQVLDKPLPDEEIKAHLILRCGAAERLILETPAHAAVDAWVSLMAQDPNTARFKNLANAVLRRVVDQGKGAFLDSDPLEDLPDWLAERWVETYGEPVARAIAIARSVPPTLDLTAKPGFDAQSFADEIGAKVLETGTIRRPDIGAVDGLPGFEAGDWWVQDVAAALPARILNVKPGEKVADLCAAPGGKTLQLAAAGASVIAVDASPKRLKRLAENLERTKLNAEIVTADVADWTAPEPMDAILLDAPCSATGTLRRRPDAAWAKEPGDIANLAEIQRRLLDASFAQLKSGGRLVYCTCSLELEEGEDQIAAFLDRTPDARLDPVTADELPGLKEALRPDGAVRTRPDMWDERGGMDGFYIARIVKA
ncbi:RsmB/NOP family class I SAM-dependent RNA methyltransferase [Oceanicaulis alexandrii]|uniref:RsmB/NOP family class I SAM-dependent RNA methyltransferase n=1 Tax=Oceanicaulis alexandrii TaxID=153233 RepID=UPI0003B33BB5|nr:transcription antitermination factor NusB [Oceanicaulis alexandrii]